MKKMRRDDYIAEIQVVFGGSGGCESEKLPDGEGWELVEKSASGKSANLNKVRTRFGFVRKYFAC